MRDALLLEKSYPKDNFPVLPCPKCKASLKLNQKTLIDEETAGSTEASNLGVIEPEDRVGVFAGMMRCVDCREVVAVCGTSSIAREFVDGDHRIVEYLSPKSFVPTLQIFEAPENLPDPIADALTASFAAFWSNPSAAGNALRIAVEELMTCEGVRKFPQGKRRGPLDLHARIEIYRLQQARRADLLLAVKWIGNVGSHQTDELTRKDVLDGYHLFERVLTETFHPSDAMLRLAKKIIKAKGPVRVRPKSPGRTARRSV